MEVRPVAFESLRQLRPFLKKERLSMQRWAYRRLFVWEYYSGTWFETPKRDQRGWYIECKNDNTGGRNYLNPVRQLLYNYLYAGGSTPTRLPLNPAHEWKTLEHYERLAWDTDSEQADLAISVIASLGEDGWELVGIDHVVDRSQIPAFPKSMFFIFKRPLE